MKVIHRGFDTIDLSIQANIYPNSLPNWTQQTQLKAGFGALKFGRAKIC